MFAGGQKTGAWHQWVRREGTPAAAKKNFPPRQVFLFIPFTQAQAPRLGLGGLGSGTPNEAENAFNHKFYLISI